MGRSVSNISGRLLVVDDNKVNRLLLGRGLEQQGHSVAFAENGRKALEALREGNYDLMLLDIQMPEMDGYVVKCIELGAEDYLTKPVNPVLLRARVNASLEKKRLRDQQRELIRKFATEEVAEDLEASGLSLGGKYVEATTMFCDIRSFTTIAESQSPADTIELLNDYYTLMFEAISGHGGVVNQMVGDGLMAIFGAPLPLEDRRERAVRAALEMVEMIQLFNLEQSARGKAEIRIGVGIASGQVIAGYTGTLRRVTYTCVGDAVNVAARLQEHTKVLGEPILIDEDTRQGLSRAIRTVPHGLVEVKGKTREVQVHSVPVESDR